MKMYPVLMPKCCLVLRFVTIKIRLYGLRIAVVKLNVGHYTPC